MINKRYLNGVYFGIKFTIKIFSHCKDIKEGLRKSLFILQSLEKIKFDNIEHLWQVLNYYLKTNKMRVKFKPVSYQKV